MEKRIVAFIQEHHLLTLAAASGGDLWCASAFYVFDPDIPAFVIASEERTRHIQLALESCMRGWEDAANKNEKPPIVAGTVALETEQVGMIRGIQFRAEVKKTGASLLDRHRLMYLKRFPYAVLKGGDLWLLELTELKFTDNRLGFGKKLHWEK